MDTSEWIVNDGPEDYCFGCGHRNESGLKLRFRRMGDASVETTFEVPDRDRGAQGIVHGGIRLASRDGPHLQLEGDIVDRSGQVLTEAQARFRLLD